MKNSKDKAALPPTDRRATVDNNEGDPSDGKEIHDLELGEYFLHVYILETANLDTEKEINAIINITAMDGHKYTKVIKGLGPSSKTFWGDHVFFQKKFESREELENARFTLTVYNYSSLLKNDKIGSTSGLLVNIYGQDQHCLIEQWAILTNPEVNFKSAMGFIKFSACFDKVSKRHPNLELLSLGTSSSSFDLLAIPPEISLKSKQLVIKLFRGKNIVPMDFDGTADPFVKFDVGGAKIQSSIVKSTLSPVFNQVLYIPLLYPNVFEKMKMSFKDYDLIGKNEIIGSAHYLLKDIEAGQYSKPHWVYFYGGYAKCVDKEFLKTMNTNSELGSRITGNLLLSVEIADSKETKFTVEEMSKEDVAQANQITNIEFVARIDVDYIENIKREAKELRLCIQWGSYESFKSEYVSYTRGVLILNKRFEIRETFEVSEKMGLFEQLPDIIISIADRDQHFSYMRLKPSEYTVSSSQPYFERISRMNADLAIDNTPEDKAGIIKIRIGVEKTSLFPSIAPLWPQLPEKAYFEKIYLVIHLVRAKDLLPSDPTATSDPIVQFYHLGSVVKSSLFPETLNPSWNERIILQSNLINGHLAPLVVNVNDRDENFIGTVSYDFLGCTYIVLDKSFIARKKTDLLDIKPLWYDLAISKNLNLGKILLGVTVAREEFFSLIERESPMNQNASITKPLTFTKTKHHVKISILGLRNLQSNGMLPVKSVNVKINTSSLKQARQMQKGSAFTNLTAASKSGGANPSIGTVLSLTVNLPDEFILIPTLSCQVLENSLSFLKDESLIGTFYIELALHAYISRVTMIEKLKVIQKYRQDLKAKEKRNAAAHEDVLSKINGIIKHLEAGVVLNLGYIKNEEKEMYLKGEEIKANINMVTSSALFDFIDNAPDRPRSPDTVNVKEDKSPPEPPRAMTLEEDKGFFSVFLPETSPAEDEKLALLSARKVQLDSASQRLMALKVSEIVPQERIVVIPDKQNPLWVAPNPKFYYALGYKSKKSDNRHYRFFISIPLEESYYMGEDLYTSIDIFRGKKPNFEKKDFLTRVFSRFEENYKKTGAFKGNVDIIQDEVLNQIIDLKLTDKEHSSLEIPRSIEEWKYSKLDADMLKGTKVVISLYVISALFYTSQDLATENDSYLKAHFGGKTIIDNKVIVDQNNPKYFKKFTFEGAFPGPSDLTLEFFDKDDLNPDDLIGSTIIDVERRFFDRRWRSFSEKPIETRKIYHPNNESPVGEVMLWTDIEPITKKAVKAWSIDPRPATMLELRIVVWEIRDMPCMDIEDVSDLYVTVGLPTFDMIQKTDVHLRSHNGYGCFNWRTVFKLKIDENCRPENFRALFRVFDKDLLTTDDFTADYTLDFSTLVESVLESETRSNLTGTSVRGKEGSKEFVIPLNVVKSALTARQRKRKPYMVISIDLLSESMAAGSPAGIGRSDPNQDPYLPPPKGRFGFSFNPLIFMEQMMGPGFEMKILGIICLIFIALVILTFVPLFISTLVSMIIVKAIDP